MISPWVLHSLLTQVRFKVCWTAEKSEATVLALYFFPNPLSSFSAFRSLAAYSFSFTWLYFGYRFLWAFVVAPISLSSYAAYAWFYFCSTSPFALTIGKQYKVRLRMKTNSIRKWNHNAAGSKSETATTVASRWLKQSLPFRRVPLTQST